MDGLLSSNYFFILNDTLYPLIILILQLVLIIAATRFCTLLMKKAHQPEVVGQIIAGILLGPSLLGLLLPHIWQTLFSADSLRILSILSQTGIILFMFLVGMELDLSSLKHKIKSTFIISYAGMIAPFILGMLTAIILHQNYCPTGVSMLSFSLFLGTAMSITAFPVLARIVQERGITHTPVGITALASAALGDISAWCILAIIIALVTTGSIFAALSTIALAAAYLYVMITVLRPRLTRYLNSHRQAASRRVAVFIMIIASAFLTEMIGLHAIFGAFTAGAIMPNHSAFATRYAGKISALCLLILLPVFFAFSGLRTYIGALNSWNEWLVCLLVILIATIGKFGGCLFGARIAGEKWKDALTIGVLMNTRGLMELIILNIGYELGVISIRMFTILVFMALVTTFLTNPLLDLINKFRKSRR